MYICNGSARSYSDRTTHSTARRTLTNSSAAADIVEHSTAPRHVEILGCAQNKPGSITEAGQLECCQHRIHGSITFSPEPRDVQGGPCPG